MENYRYYFFIAMGTGENKETSRETFLKIDISDINEERPKKIIKRTIEYYSCHYMLKDLLEALGKNEKEEERIKIDLNEIYIVPTPKWNSPDLGVVREYDFSNMIEFPQFALKMKEPIEKYLKKNRFINWESMGYGFRESSALIGHLIKVGERKKKLFGIFG